MPLCRRSVEELERSELPFNIANTQVGAQDKLQNALNEGARRPIHRSAMGIAYVRCDVEVVYRVC